MRQVCQLLVAAMALSGCAAPGARDGIARHDTEIAGHDIELALLTRVSSGRIAARMTLGALLRAHEVAEAEAAALIRTAQTVFDLRKVRADQAYRIEQAPNGAVKAFDYEIDGDRYLRVRRVPGSDDDGSLEADIVAIPKTHAQAVVRGTITRDLPSLFAAVDAAGGNVDLALALADIFSGEVDFNTDLQPGDRFSVVVDRQFREAGTFAGYGPILAARFENDGRHLEAVRFAPDGAPPEYFDERGTSTRRFFLKSPLKFAAAVSSPFSPARFHPILKEVRAHLGVDFRAPIGAPVIAVADGVVLQAGVSGDAGRMVHLRHANGFESEYLHLSTIAVRIGARVRQGDLIGQVGQSGLATGPHLDFRVRKNGAFINPLHTARAMPPGEPIPAGQLPAFTAARDHALQALAR
jgi:murein DD-endopeptidase MepM/ murein hydrolase activator NlpD